MASLDSLPADQRAVLQLVLQRDRSYDDIASLLSIDRAAVRDRALAALDALGPQTRVAPERRALITDYLLGQLPGPVVDQVRGRLAESAAERAWARVVSSELVPLAGKPLPEIPDEAPGATQLTALAAAASLPDPGAAQPTVTEPPPPPPAAAAQPSATEPPPPAAAAQPTATEPPPPPPAAAAQPTAIGPPPPPPEAPTPPEEPTAAPTPTAMPAPAAPPPPREPPPSPEEEPPAGRRRSRVGGAILLGGGALIVILILFIVFSLTGGSSKKHSSTAASQSATTSSPASTSSSTVTTGSASASTPVPVAQINLSSPDPTIKAKGVAEVVKQGTNTGILIIATGLAPNTKHPPNAYAVWLYNSPNDNHILGFVNPGVAANGKLQTEGALPTNAGHYKQLIVTLETQAKPAAPGKIILQGALTGV